MSAGAVPFEIHQAPVSVTSAVNAEAMTADRSPMVINLSSAGVETRTLSRPTRAGVLLTLHCQVSGGNITVTVTGGYDTNGDTTFVFTAVGQTLTLQSFQTSAGVYFWRKVSDYGIGNLTAAAAGGASALAVVGVAAGYKVARGETALDGANPTPVTTGLTTCIAFLATLKGSVAPGVGTCHITSVISGGGANVYAWGPTGAGDCTLIASTGTESFYWVAVGT